MTALFIPATFISFWFYFFNNNGKNPSVRETFLQSAIAVGIIIVFITEALSPLRLLRFSCLTMIWGVLFILSLTLSLWNIRKTNPLKNFSSPKLCVSEKFFVSIMSFIVILLAVIAYLAPPNTYDSMTYHMTRVAHWVQNMSVSNYPTNGLRQLAYNPGAEYLILQVQILARSDQGANFIQWFSMLGSLLAGSLIAKKLGAQRRGQIIAALLITTIPMGILQATGTQNDYVAAFWLASYVYFLLKALSSGRWPAVIFSGLSLGLALLTKGTAYIYCAPFLLWFFISTVGKNKKKSFQFLVSMAALIICINSNFYLRNITLGGHPLKPTKLTRGLINEHFSPRTLLSNMSKNVALHLNTPIKGLNIFFENSVLSFHRLIGIDPNDPRLTFGSNQFHIPDIPLHEDHAPNFFHLIIAFFCIAAYLSSRNLKRNKDLGIYLLSLLSSFSLFCLMIKWQPWHSRLHLPLFVLLSPFTGIILGKIKKQTLVNVILISLILLSLPRIFKNSSRGLISSKQTVINTSRNDQYFANKSHLLKPYKAAVEYIKKSGCSQIGLKADEESWEYPVWALLKNQGIPFRAENINVKNASAKYKKNVQLNDFIPCLIIDLENTKDNILTVSGHSYTKIKTLHPMSIFLKDDDGTLRKATFITNFKKTLQQAGMISKQVLNKNISFIKLIYDKQTQIQIRQTIRYGIMVDLDLLNQSYPELGNHFDKELLMGLKLLALGADENDRQKYEYGILFVSRWGTWFSKHENEIISSMTNL